MFFVGLLAADITVPSSMATSGNAECPKPTDSVEKPVADIQADCGGRLVSALAALKLDMQECLLNPGRLTTGSVLVEKLYTAARTPQHACALCLFNFYESKACLI